MKNEHANTILAGSWQPNVLAEDVRKPTPKTVVAGSWGSGLDGSKTVVDMKALLPRGAKPSADVSLRPNREVRAALGKTVALPAMADARPGAKGKPAALNATMLLAPAAAKPSAAVDPTKVSARKVEVVAAAPTRAFEISVIENAAADIRYRDALRRGEDEAFFLMTDFLGAERQLPAQLLAAWQKAVRGAVAAGAPPSAVLELLNRQLGAAGLEATATCVRFDARARRLVVASAGGPDPFVIHANERYTRLLCSPAGALGRVAGARYTEQTFHFERKSTLLVPSTAWVAPLEAMFAAPIDLALRTLGFAVRERRAQPKGGALLRLTTS